MAKTKIQLEEDTPLDDEVSTQYKKFFDRFSEIENVSLESWKSIHVLAYICKKYREYYGFKYSFRFNNPSPSRSFEIYQIKKLSNMLSANPKILKEYIDWIFDKKIIERKKKVTSLGYFTHQDIVNEFKFNFIFDKKEMSRSDMLPQNVVSICNKYGMDNITTYGHLAFLKKMPNTEPLIQEIAANGFNVEILDRIQ